MLINVQMSVWFSVFLADNEGVLKEPSLVRLFLTMHPWYLSSSDLAKKLLHKYPPSADLSHYTFSELCISKN